MIALHAIDAVALYVHKDNPLTGLTLDLFDLPSMSSTDIQGYYLTTEERQFNVSVTNPANGGTFGETIYYKFQISGGGT